MLSILLTALPHFPVVLSILHLTRQIHHLQLLPRSLFGRCGGAVDQGWSHKLHGRMLQIAGFFRSLLLGSQCVYDPFSAIVAFAGTWSSTPWTKRKAHGSCYVAVPINLSPGSELVEVRGFAFRRLGLARVKGYGVLTVAFSASVAGGRAVLALNRLPPPPLVLPNGSLRVWVG